MIQIVPADGVKGDLAPIVRIVSPLADSSSRPVKDELEDGSPNGAGFAVNLEIVTATRRRCACVEATNIRRVDLLTSARSTPAPRACSTSSMWT